MYYAFRTEQHLILIRRIYVKVYQRLGKNEGPKNKFNLYEPFANFLFSSNFDDTEQRAQNYNTFHMKVI